MDIVITLPGVLINRIMNGAKKFEVRKTFPGNFMKGVDRVYVVQKKTTNVLISFTVDYFKPYVDANSAWKRHGHELGIPVEWLRDYAQTAYTIFLWHIVDVQVFENPLQLEENFGIKRAPQSFCYVRKFQ